MKIRTGFVSNSSSSSFMLVANKEEFEATVKEMHPYIKFMVNGGKTHDFGESQMIAFVGEDSTEELPYELENGYTGEVLEAGGSVAGVIPEEMEDDLWNIVDDWDSGSYPAYKGDCLNLVSEKMKEKGKPVIYQSELT